MKKFLKEPFLHFILLGAMLFALNDWRQQQRPPEQAAGQIEVTAAVIERLRSGYERQFKWAPDENELRDQVAMHIREEVLFREALALGLDRNDSILRRRLAQKMEFLTDDVTSAVEPDDADLQRYFNENAARYAEPELLSFRHIYFSTEKRGADSAAAASEALVALGKGANEETMGDAFLHGYEFEERAQEDLTALFGSEFTEAVAAQSEGGWSGPVASSYGLHLVKVEARVAGRQVTLDKVRDAVLRDFNEERRRAANKDIFERLRERYKVTVDEAALTKAAAPASKGASR